MIAMIELRNAEKTFVMHLQGGVRLPVMHGVNFDVNAGECVVLSGPSGAGKSSILKMIFGNYRCDGGTITVRHLGAAIDVASAEPRQILSVRRNTIGYVSQFLRAVPRIAAIDVVAEPLLNAGVSREDAHMRAGALLKRLNIGERLWQLPPSTFSGGEQQRVNVARGFARRYPILLLDEPTASLDPVNRDVVVSLIQEALADGVAIVGIFHDVDVRQRVGTREFTISNFAANAPKEGIAA